MALVSARLGYGRERRNALLTRGLQLARDGGDQRTLAEALSGQAFHLIIQERREEALPIANEAVECARATGDSRLVAQSLIRQAMAVFPTDPALGRKLFDEAISRFAACDDPDGTCHCFLNLAEEFFAGGDVEAALRASENGIAAARTLKSRDRLLMSLSNAAAYHVSFGNFDKAREFARESAMLARGAESWQTAAFAVQHLSAVALHNGDVRTATRLLGWCDARLKAIDEARQETEQQEYQKLIAELQDKLTPEAFQSFVAEGAMLSGDSAYEEALRV